jgi:hypothetical protein
MLRSIDFRLRHALLAVVIGSAVGAAADTALVVNVVDGEGSFNDIRRGEVRTPVVEVQDPDGHPVIGAKVVFQLPDVGASAAFADGSKMLIATTGEDGKASAPGLRPNHVEGSFVISVLASKDGMTGRAQIRQSNTLAGGDPNLRPNNHNKLKLLIAVAGAAGGIVVAAALHGGGGSSNSSTSGTGAVATTLSVGAITIGGPR